MLISQAASREFLTLAEVAFWIAFDDSNTMPFGAQVMDMCITNAISAPVIACGQANAGALLQQSK
jgi:hypothetical protein